MIKFFIVEVKCGHVGRNKYIPIKFPVKASNTKEAVKIVKDYKRVKKGGRKDIVLDVYECSKEEYEKQEFCNSKDPYLQVKSKWQQNKIMPLIEHRIVYEEESVHKRKRNKKESVKYRQKKNSIIIQNKESEIRDYMNRCFC